MSCWSVDLLPAVSDVHQPCWVQATYLLNKNRRKRLRKTNSEHHWKHKWKALLAFRSY